MDNGASSYRRFLEGDDNGFVEIVRDYKDGLILYLNSFTGDIEKSQELAEDTFVKLGVKKPKNKEKASFKTWLYTIGRNTAMDYLRRRRRIYMHELPIENCKEIADVEKNLEGIYIRNERKIAVHRAVYKLNYEYRQVLWLIYFEDFSHKETALIMNKSISAVETLVYRARKALKVILEKEDIDFENL